MKKILLICLFFAFATSAWAQQETQEVKILVADPKVHFHLRDARLHNGNLELYLVRQEQMRTPLYEIISYLTRYRLEDAGLNVSEEILADWRFSRGYPELLAQKEKIGYLFHEPVSFPFYIRSGNLVYENYTFATNLSSLEFEPLPDQRAIDERSPHAQQEEVAENELNAKEALRVGAALVKGAIKSRKEKKEGLAEQTKENENEPEKSYPISNKPRLINRPAITSELWKGRTKEYYHKGIFFDQKRGLITLLVGLDHKGKYEKEKAQKRMEYRDLHFLTYDIHGKIINHTPFPVEHSVEPHLAVGLEEEVQDDSLGIITAYSGYVYVLGQAYRKEDDPDNRNFWFVHLDENGRLVYKHKIQVPVEEGTLRSWTPVLAKRSGDDIVLLSVTAEKKVGARWTVVRINESGVKSFDILPGEKFYENFKGDKEALPALWEPGNISWLENKMDETDGTWSLLGYSYEERQASSGTGSVPYSSQVEKVYTGFFYMQIDKDNNVPQVAAVKLENKKGYEADLIKHDDKEILLLVRNHLMERDTLDNSRLYSRISRKIDPQDFKKYNKYLSTAVVLKYDKTSGEWHRLDVDKDFVLLGERPYLYVEDQKVLYLFGRKVAEELGREVFYLTVKRIELQ